MVFEPRPETPWAPPPPGARPVVLLADSRLLFQPLDAGLLLARLLDALPTRTPRAAYIGASNGDDPAFYALFEAALDAVGVTRRRQIPSRPTDADREWLDHADLVLLSGGDVARGWRALRDSGLDRTLERRYREGAVLIGVSAGAVQLGLGLLDESPGDRLSDHSGGDRGLVRTLGLVPYAIGAHDEARGWRSLSATVARFGGQVRGYGLPFGGGLLAHPDGTLEPLGLGAIELDAETRRPLVAATDNRLPRS